MGVLTEAEDLINQLQEINTANAVERAIYVEGGSMEKLLKKFIEKIDFTNVKGMCADMGFQLKFPILTIFASYSFADHYGMVNGRIGTGFRESSSLI